MNIHKNARLTLIRRVEMVEDVLLNRIPSCQVAAHIGVREATVRKWLGRFLARPGRLGGPIITCGVQSHGPGGRQGADYRRAAQKAHDAGKNRPVS